MKKQQGDVLFEKVKTVKGKKIKNFDGILAKGEVTGHSHRVKTLDTCSAINQNGFVLLVIKENTDIVHEEHKTITLEPGTWKVGHVKEYDHFKEEAQNVRD